MPDTEDEQINHTTLELEVDTKTKDDLRVEYSGDNFDGWLAALKVTVERELSGQWDANSGSLTASVKFEAPADVLDEDGLFHDPLTEETVMVNESDQLRERFNELVEASSG